MLKMTNAQYDTLKEKMLELLDDQALVDELTTTAEEKKYAKND